MKIVHLYIGLFLPLIILCCGVGAAFSQAPWHLMGWLIVLLAFGVQMAANKLLTGWWL